MRSALLLPLVLVGCKKPVEAPEDLDSLLHFLWATYETGSDEELLAAAANLGPLVQEASSGLVSHLTDAEQATVDLDPPRDIALATGVFVAGPMACPMAPLERILYALEQEQIYEEATGKESYDAYERHYTSDFAAYEARTEPYLTWQTTYTVTPVFSTYTAVISGGMRFVPEVDGVGPMVIQRSWLPSPAVFENDDGPDYFDQDYQLDVLLPDGDDASVHAYATWRDLRSAGLQDESAGVQGLLIGGLEDYDRDTEVVCATGAFDE